MNTEKNALKFFLTTMEEQSSTEWEKNILQEIKEEVNKLQAGAAPCDLQQLIEVLEEKIIAYKQQAEFLHCDYIEGVAFGFEEATRLIRMLV